jgi:hypothetical protein
MCTENIRTNLTLPKDSLLRASGQQKENFFRSGEDRFDSISDPSGLRISGESAPIFPHLQQITIASDLQNTNAWEKAERNALKRSSSFAAYSSE